MNAPRCGLSRGLTAPIATPTATCSRATGRLLQEDEKILELVKQLGVKSWSQVAAALPGRIGKQCRERCVFYRPALRPIVA